MTLYLNGTTGISGVDGSAGTPAVQGTDTNTGISFPAADTIAFNEGGAEVGRFDSSGRFLVGTSTNSGGSVVQIQGPSSTAAASIGSLTLRSGYTPITNFTTDPIGKIDFQVADGGVCAQIQGYTNGANVGTNDYPGALLFSVTQDGSASPTERLRINNAGIINIFSSDQGLNSRISAGSGTNEDIFLGRHSATNTSSGTISIQVKANGNVQNTNNSYGALSDIKLKENIVDANSQWNDLKALRVRNYNLKEETNQQTHTQIGLVAQEAELVSPGLVYESPDRDEEGNDLGTVTKSVNYSVLYMKAVKALQEAMERIEQLETSNADLLARVTALETP